MAVIDNRKFFSELGLDNFEVGIDIVERLSLGDSEIHDPRSIEKIKNIAQFMKGISGHDFLLRKLVNNHKGPKELLLNHVTDYVTLRNMKAAINKEIDATEMHDERFQLQMRLHQVDNELMNFEPNNL